MKTINTAILSFGMSGWVFHAPFIYKHPGFTFYAVWERSKNLAKQKYPDAKVYRTLEELLRDEAVELVIVNTPNYTHYEYTKKALEAGKHVIVEKPFAVTVAEAEELEALAKKEGRVLTVYHNRRFDSDFKTVKKVLDEGLLGEVVEAEIHYDRYKEDLSPKVHKETPGPGAGALYDLGSHLVDQAVQLFGMPEALFADIAIMRPVSQVDDFFELLLFYPGKRVRLRCSYLVREALPGYVIHGSKGSFIKAKTDVQETAVLEGREPGSEGWGMEPESQKGLLHTERNGKVFREYLASEHGNYMDFFDAVYKSLSEKCAPPVLPGEATNVIRIIEAAFKSSREGKVIQF